MRARLLLAATAAAAVAVSLPASAATPKPQVTDATGDANGVNGQGVATGGPSFSSPASVAGADVVSVTFATTFKKVGTKKVPTGFTVALKLAAAPMSKVIYRVTAVSSQCTDLFFEYVAAGSTVVRCPASDPTKPDTEYKVPAAKVTGSTITWRIPATAIPVGSTFTNLSGTTRLVTSTPAISLTAPQIDEGTNVDAKFVVGH